MKLEQKIYSSDRYHDFDAGEIERKRHFIKDEEKGIKEYKNAIKKSKGREREVYEKILPQEENHLKNINKI